MKHEEAIILRDTRLEDALKRNKYPKFTNASVVFDGKYLAYLLENLKEPVAKELHAFVDSKKPTQVYFHY